MMIHAGPEGHTNLECLFVQAHIDAKITVTATLTQFTIEIIVIWNIAQWLDVTWWALTIMKALFQSNLIIRLG